MRWWLLLLVPACSFGARSAATGDAAVDARIDGAPDAPPDAGRLDCMARWMSHTVQFGAPVELTALNTTGYERDPFLSTDELTIYFSSGRADSLPTGSLDIYMATRSEIGDAFGPASKFLAASTADGGDGKVSMTADGTLLFVSTDHAGGQGGYDVWGAKQTASVWGPLSDAGGINDINDIFDPAVSANGLHLYYSPAQPTPQHIVEATRGSLSTSFASPMTLTELSDPNAGVGDPAISADEHVIVFSSSRTGSIGGGDLWYATRTGTTGAFSQLTIVPTVNTGSAEGDAHLSADGCRLYFASQRNAGTDWDLFVAEQQ